MKNSPASVIGRRHIAAKTAAAWPPLGRRLAEQEPQLGAPIGRY